MIRQTPYSGQSESVWKKTYISFNKMPQTTFPSDSLELSMLVFHVHASIYRDVGPTLVAVEQV